MDNLPVIVFDVAKEKLLLMWFKIGAALRLGLFTCSPKYGIWKLERPVIYGTYIYRRLHHAYDILMYLCVTSEQKCPDTNPHRHIYNDVHVP